MSDPAIYAHHPSSVQVVQTHISVVFIAGDLVYKVKKPLNFGFLDFTSLEKRRFFCQQEVILNSRFSKGIYLDVVSIHQGPRGLNLIGEGTEIETAVLMKYVPEKYLMATMLADEQITHELLDRIADRLAYFHSQAERSGAIKNFGSVEVIRQNLRENFDQTRPYIGKTISSQTHQEISSLSFDFLKIHTDFFRERVRRGFIRDCHGDLHLHHVIILDEIMLYDCIEFNDRFRYSDTAADLAFLLMDLDSRGWPDFAERISRRYAVSAHDPDVLKLLGFYKSYRAFVRGKVLGFTLDEPEISSSEKEAAASRARDYFRLALAFLKPSSRPTLIVMTGLMGTGKTFLARKLGARLGAETLRSDVVRKEILGIPAEEHRLDKYGQGIYRPNATDRTYQALLERARERLNRGKSVILDASFMRYRDRMAARESAQETQANFRIVECACPEDIIRSRLEKRLTETGEPSDGRWEILSLQRDSFEKVRQEEGNYHRIWDSTTLADAFLKPFVLDLICA
jgi:aminoglycoside phosphotransferase family enzyme/predicted kinase